MKILCWIRHKWRESWPLERVCERCGKRQFKLTLWDKWETVTLKNPIPHRIIKKKDGEHHG